MNIETRKPTGKPSWPLFLVEGPEKCGKTYMAAQLTTTGRFSRAFWIDWGEGSADEYGAMPGADYEVVIHDGTFRSVANQIHAIHEFAKQQEERGEPPVLLVIDSMTAEWEELKSEANDIAVKSPSGRRKLEKDPGADVPIPMHAWNTVGEKHGRLMRLLMTFPGVVVMTARGKDVAALDEHGRPKEGVKEYKVEGHKNLAFDASVVIRLSRERPPQVVGMRSLNHGIRPGKDKAIDLGERSLEDVTWGVLFRDASPETRALPAAGETAQVSEEDRIQNLASMCSDRREIAAGDVTKLNQLHAWAVAKLGDDHAEVQAIETAIHEAHAQAEPAPPELEGYDYGTALKELGSIEDFEALLESADQDDLVSLFAACVDVFGESDSKTARVRRRMDASGQQAA